MPEKRGKSPELTIELVRILPSILRTVCFTILVVILRKSILQLILQLGESQATGKEELAELPYEKRALPPDEHSQVMRRARRIAPILDKARLLLVNDVPQEMTEVCEALRSFGISVDIARTTGSATSMMEQVRYDLIISDMRRDGVPDEGLNFLNKTIERGIHRPTIFTVGQFDPSRGVPAYAFGITNRVDELFNLVFDALERERG